MIRNHSILFVILATISSSFQAQNKIAQSSLDKNVEIVDVSTRKNSDFTNLTSKDNTEVQFSMSSIIIKNEAIESEQKANPNVDKEPRIEMFTIRKDSVKLRVKKR